MRIEKTKESTFVEVELTDAPSMQMFSGVGYTSNLSGFYTWAPRRATVSVIDGAFDSIVLYYDHHTGRSFKADDMNMTNWIREMVSEILVGREVEWLEADYRANEYVIERRDENDQVVMSVAIVADREVARFLMVKRDKLHPSDFLIRRSGGEGGTVAGDLWLLRHTDKATV